MPKIYISDYKYNDFINGTEETHKYSDSLVLYRSNWNDFGYYTTFGLCYYSENNDEVLDLGFLSICHQDMNIYEENANRIMPYLDKYKSSDGSLNKLDENFCSLFVLLSSYKRLFNACKESYTEILENLQDITLFNPDKISSFEKSDVFKKSNIRYDEPKLIYKLTKLKNEIDIQDDTYTFIRNLHQYYTKIKDKKEYEQRLLELGNEYAEVTIFAKKIFYYCRDNNIIKEQKDLITAIKKQNKKSAKFIEEIDCALDIHKNIIEIVRSIKKQLVLDKDKIPALGHYTPINNLKYLISNKKSTDQNKDNIDENKNYLRLTNSKQLNDPMEGKWLLQYLIEDDTIDTEFQESNIYLTSATTKLDSLPMWKQYTDNADGVLLEYSEDFLKGILEKCDVEIAKVCYFDFKNENGKPELVIDDASIKKLLEDLKEEIKKLNLKEKKDVMKNLMPISFLFKNKYYSYESEYRIIVDEVDHKKIVTQEKDTYPLPMLYTYLDKVPLKYSKVTLAPKAIDIDFIGPYIKHCDKDITIIRSKIPFR